MHDIRAEKTRSIAVKENILDVNDRIADRLNHELTHRGVFAVNEMGAPGVGKTTVLFNLIERLKKFAPYVIEGDIESDLDSVMLRERGVPAFQINTFGACHLDAPLIEKALGEIEFKEERILLFIENVGNLVCPAEFSIGEHIKLLVCSVTEGSDKPYKYPLAFHEADMILLNKVDLIPYLDFDEEFFLKGLRALNKDAPLIKVSGKTGEGFDEAAAGLERMAESVLGGHGAKGHHGHDHDHGHSHNHDHNHDR